MSDISASRNSIALFHPKVFLRRGTRPAVVPKFVLPRLLNGLRHDRMFNLTMTKFCHLGIPGLVVLCC